MRGRAPRLSLLAGAAIIAMVGALGLLSFVWTPVPPAQLRIALRLKPPLVSGLAGTDALGHDIFSMLMAGAWNSLSIAVTAVLFGAAIGTMFGTVAAIRGRLLAEFVLRGADVVFAFPALITAIMIAALIGPGRVTAILAIGLFVVPVFVRLSRGAALGALAQDYCLAAEAMGQSRSRIVTRHVLPNIAGPLVVQATLQIGLAILVEAGLGFVGLSLPPPAPSWGRMLSDAQTYLGQAPWMAVAPGLAIALSVLGLNLLGDGLRDWFDPRA